MFTQCPTCNTLFRADAPNLRSAMGMVRCTQCKNVFNALAALISEHAVDASNAVDLGSQLRVREFGDATLIDPNFLASQEWYVEALESTRPQLPPKEQKAPWADISKATQVAQAAPATTTPTPLQADATDSITLDRASWFTRFITAAFGQTFNLALRNLLRHRRRSALAMGAIGFGVIALILAGGFAEWMIWKERESTIHSRLGHIQLVRKGFFEKGVADPHAYLIQDNVVDTKRLASLPHIKTVTPRLNFSGLISKGDTTVSFLAEGVAPATEKEVSEELIVHDGKNLDDLTPSTIILGRGLAAVLGAKTGDDVVLLTNDKEGKVSAIDATVGGIFHTAVKAYDDVSLRAPIRLARKLMRAGGSHQLLVLLDETENTDAVIGTLRHLIPQQTDLQLVPWLDLAEFYKSVVALFSAQTVFVRSIIAIIIIMSISNTLAMSVMERTAEIGTMMAMGFRGRRIMQLFVSEGFIIGLIGGVLGTALGYGLAVVISHIGIPMPPAPGMDDGFVASIRVTWQIALSGFLIAIVSSVLASLYPAWKASKLNIVDALRRAR